MEQVALSKKQQITQARRDEFRAQLREKPLKTISKNSSTSRTHLRSNFVENCELSRFSKGNLFATVPIL